VRSQRYGRPSVGRTALIGAAVALAVVLAVLVALAVAALLDRGQPGRVRAARGTGVASASVTQSDPPAGPAELASCYALGPLESAGFTIQAPADAPSGSFMPVSVSASAGPAGPLRIVVALGDRVVGAFPGGPAPAGSTGVTGVLLAGCSQHPTLETDPAVAVARQPLPPGDYELVALAGEGLPPGDPPRFASPMFRADRIPITITPEASPTVPGSG
jgi:hypothetical protein